MKRILVPTDFSDTALLAWEAALLLANKFNADVHLLHCADLPKGWDGWPLREQDKEPAAKATVKAAMARLQQTYAVSGSKTNVHYAVKGGKLYELVEAYRQAHDIDLIVMGSHGTSGKSEFFVGSNTQKVVRYIHANILVIKERMEQLDFSEVLFATGLSQDDLTTFRRFLAFIRPFHPKTIHIIAVNIPGFFSQPAFIMHEGLKEMQNLAGGYNCKTHFANDFTVASGIRHFAEQHGIDLIAISNHERHPWKRLFRGSNVEFVVNHAQAPVLSMDYDQ